VKRCGTIAIVGRPNVGKSTLLNRVCGTHLSIVSPRPQTTRVDVRGVVTRPEGQIVFVDTPGWNQQARALSRAMLRRITESLIGADIVVLMTDVFPALRRAIEERGPEAAYVHPVDRKIMKRVLDPETRGRPVVLVINKVDALPRRNHALPLLDAWGRAYGMETMVPVSARTGLNVPHLVDVLAGMLPEGEFLFPDDALTDRPERFFTAEIVRESAFHLLRDEIPYAVAVVIEHWIEEEGRLVIEARIIVETESQKRIVVGKGGKMIKEIGTQARRRINRFLDRRVHLSLRASVRENWTSDPGLVENLVDRP